MQEFVRQNIDKTVRLFVELKPEGGGHAVQMAASLGAQAAL